MGLAGRKVKQRIGHDPRNLSWADDAARFGQNYLSKFGWDASKGLGAEGEGRISAIKVSQKLDMMGIGAAHTKDVNGIAWQQNKDYENLLARLNAAAAGDTVAPTTGVVAEGGFVSATVEEEEVTKEESKEAKKEKKRKRKEEDGEKKSKKRKKEKSPEASAAEDSSDDERAPAPVVRPILRRAHRSRHIAAKSMASKSAAAISEILGIAPTPSSLSSSGSPMGALTPISDEPASLEKLTKSTKSVADYFKERLAAKAAAKAGSSTPTPTAPFKIESAEEEETPRRGLGSARARDDEADAPRGGLGAGRRREDDGETARSGLGLGAGRSLAIDEDAPRGGLGSFARMFQMPSAAPTTETGKGMAMFASLSSARVLAGVQDEPAVDKAATSGAEKERKREKKEKKRKAKEAAQEDAEEKKEKKEKRKKSKKDVEAGDDVEEKVPEPKAKKDKKGKRKEERAGVDELSSGEGMDSKKRKRDEPAEENAPPIVNVEESSTKDADTESKEERKAEKRRRKEKKRRKEASET
ncbi:hypothetical protein BD626DRAFT_7791 [Schizophyllum amplum]|uniref:PinX1-related protein 1 n=1 Tax=Schizophyllum amplum TaxID=97359 RepID=A0A550CWN2_9AGAR|nr:hypothetical protein BD626DRAFT_7791 [Auriculariopsis ampla]